MKILIITKTLCKYFYEHMIAFATGYNNEKSSYIIEANNFLKSKIGQSIFDKLEKTTKPFVEIKTKNHVLKNDIIVVDEFSTENEWQKTSFEIYFTSDLTVEEIMHFDSKIREYANGVGIKILDIQIK